MGAGGTQGLVDDRDLTGGGGWTIGMWVMCYHRCVGHICSWGHRDSLCTVDRLGVSDLKGCSVLGDCSELGFCEGDLGMM